MIFSATYEMLSLGEHVTRQVSGGEILFEAADKDEAWKDFRRWWANRNEAVPDHFSKILAVKIWPITVQKMDEKGYLPPYRSMWAFEWKCDWPGAHLTWKEGL